MKICISSCVLTFMVSIFSSGALVAENSTSVSIESCIASSSAVWAHGAGSTAANKVYKLNDNGGYYSDNGCFGNPGNGHKIIKTDGQWQLIDPTDNILYISDFDSEFPPAKGWRVSAGLAPAPTFGGSVTDNEIPEVTNLSVTGKAVLGDILTANYHYSHPSSIPESGSIYKWYTSTDTTGAKTLISGAENKTYELTTSEDGKYIQFVVFPFDGSSVGDSVKSLWVGPVSSIEQPRFNYGENNAISFNNDGYISLNGQSGISATSISDDFSIAMWVKTIGTNQALFGEYVNGDSHTRNYLSISGDGRISFDQWQPSGGTTTFDTIINTGNWVHIVLVRESGIRKAYINGILESTTGSAEAYTGKTPTQFHLGYRGGSSAGNNFSGEMDEVSWWSKALNSTDVSELYNGTINPKDNNLLGYLSFDDKESELISADVGNVDGSMENGMDINDRVAGPEINKAISISINSDALSGAVISDSVIQTSMNPPAFQVTDADGGPFTLNSAGKFQLTRNLTRADVGTYRIQFKVTLEGEETASVANIYILRHNNIPLASNVKVSGTVAVDSTLSASYNYSDNDGDEETGSTYKWFAATDTTGAITQIPGATTINYTLTDTEEGKYIQFIVTPNDGLAVGDSSSSFWIGPIHKPRPEMVIKGNGIEITHGDNSPTSSDSTFIGITSVADSITTATYQIKNIGDKNLVLGNSAVSINGVHASDFTVGVHPDSTVTVGDSTFFTIIFDPSDVEMREAEIQISSNDVAKNPFTFKVGGIGNAVPQIAGAVTNQQTNEDTPITPFSSVTLMDAEDDLISVVVTLDENMKGFLTGGGFTGIGPYTLSSQSVANAQAALQALEFDPTDNRVNTGETEATTFYIRVSDNWGSHIDSVTKVISTAINDVPVTIISGGVTEFVEGSESVVIDDAVEISDPDNTFFLYAEIRIDDGFQMNEDSIWFVNDNASMGNIQAEYTRETGVLILSSADTSATVAEFQAALRAVTYRNNSKAPNSEDRTISFTVNDGNASSSAGTQTIRLTTKNDPPIASNVDISGSLKVDSTLTASYDFGDADGDSESGSTYQWYSASDTTGSRTQINGATNATLILTAAEKDRYIQFEVIPNDGKEEGPSVQGAWQGPVHIPLMVEGVVALPDTATKVAIDSVLTIRFNQRVSKGDVSTVNIISSSGAKVSGVNVSVMDSALVLTHDDFEPGALYTVQVPTGAVSIGNGETNEVINWSFTTVQALPIAEALYPANNSVDIALDSVLALTFDKQITEVDLSGITIKDSTGTNVGNIGVTLSGRTLTFTHNNFSSFKKYVVSIPGGAVQNVDGQRNEEITWSFTTLNTPPIASNVDISGSLKVDSTLTATYDFGDVDGDSESGSTYKWYIADDNSGTNAVAIPGAVDTTFTLTSSEDKKYIRFEVIPNDGNEDGVSSNTTWRGPIITPSPQIVVKGNKVEITNGNNTPAESDSTFFGTVSLVDSTVSVSYYIYNVGNDILETGIQPISISGLAISDFSITTQPDAEIAPGDSSAFTLRFDPSDVDDRTVQISITHNDSDESPFTFSVSGTGVSPIPVASDVSIVGNLTTGQVLVGNYTYSGKIEEEGSTYNWYTAEDNAGSNASLIDGETNTSFTLTNTQIGKYIRFEVTPTHPYQAGSAVSSGWIGPVNDSLSVNTIIPQNGAENVVIGSDLFVKFNQPITEIDLSGISIKNSQNIEVENVTASVSDSTISITYGGLAYEEIYTVSLPANAVVSTSKDSSTALSWSFTTQNFIPVASNVTIEGTLHVEKSLTGSYVYFDEGGDTESGSMYRWFVADDNNGLNAIPISGATALSYILTANESGKYIGFEVMPNDGVDAGQAAKSTWFGPIVTPETEMFVLGNQLEIVNGKDTPATIDFTDFGEISIADTSALRTFSIINTGIDTLVLGENAVSINGENAGFTVSGQPVNFVLPGDTTAFVLRFSPTNSGVNKTTVSITNNDPDENPYSFAVQGFGVNTAPEITSTSTINIEENNTEVLTLTATDEETPTALIFSLIGGADQNAFSITNSGNLSFKTAPDFESPEDANADNVYELTVQVSDGTLTSTQQMQITITDVNEHAPVFTSVSEFTLNENELSIGTVTATDADPSDNLSFSISGGADAALFIIDGNSGNLSFKTAPDFESLEDANSDNVYELMVVASDGTLSTTQQMQITITDINEHAPVFTSVSEFTLNENELSIGTVTATDADPSDNLSFSISGGADAALFIIDGNSGVLSFVSAPDFESPEDANLDNVYELMVVASDGTLTSTQQMQITITDVNEHAPVFTSVSEFIINENEQIVGTVSATDADPSDNLSFSISGGVDQNAFNLTEAGILTLKTAPDFESPSDANADNVYELTVQVSDGTLSSTQQIQITITDVNEHAPVFTSTDKISLNENEQTVGTVTATDADPSDNLSFSVSGGVDAALFTIDGNSGVLSFVSAPDFESPEDANLDNVYELTVLASDGTLTSTQQMQITITDVNEHAPVFTSVSEFTLNENEQIVGTVTATDADPSDNLSFSISGGVDAALFALDTSSGNLSFKTAPDFESPADANADNVYELTVQVSDGTLFTTQQMQITITDVNEHAPVFTSVSEFTLNENELSIGTVTATDADPSDIVSFSISGGADAALFIIDGNSGSLSFVSAPDFESPADANADNVYELTVQVSDGTLFTTQQMQITIADVNEHAPVFTSTDKISINENELSIGTVTATDADPSDDLSFSISGGVDAALFTLDGNSGSLSFKTAPDFETPEDANADNVYEITIVASDGTLSTTQQMQITITDVNEHAPVFTSADKISLSENEQTVGTLTATDADPSDIVSFSISGGADAALFTIDGNSGSLSFKTAPDFESPEDENTDNVYEITIIASDGTLSTTQQMQITVKDVNEHAPVFTSVSEFTLNENEQTVGTVTATDADPSDIVSFSISGGADVALFTIDGNSGSLSFLSAPDYENAQDQNKDNVYELGIQVSDGTLSTTQQMQITITDVNEHAPVFTSVSEFTLNENEQTVGTLTATDADPSDNVSFSISGGADATQFTLDATTGVLSFVSAPDFESPEDANADNVYELTVVASDGTLSTTQQMQITITDVNEHAPVFTSVDEVTINENSTEVLAVTATDADPSDIVIFSISGGADQNAFNLTEAGILTFKTAPDFETPEDANADNVYELTVQVSDGTLSSTQQMQITITDVNEHAPVFTSVSEFTINENEQTVGTLTATDGDPSDNVSFSISGGADAALYTIDGNSGVLSFVSAPDFESPEDANADNVYELTVQVSDGTLFTTQQMQITITDVNEHAPVFTSTDKISLNENEQTVGTVTATDADPSDNLSFSISGGADAALFIIDGNSGVLSFVSAPDFESPEDANLDNVYELTVLASDGTLTSTQQIQITITDVNEHAPVFTSVSEFTINENEQIVGTVSATDADPSDNLSFSISGGVDQNAFNLTEAGILTLKTAPDFESPEDANTDNIYELTVQVSDGTLFTTQQMQITITDVNEHAPVFTSASELKIYEQPDLGALIITLSAEDKDSTAQLSFGISSNINPNGNGIDAFALDSETGALIVADVDDFNNKVNPELSIEVIVSDGDSVATQIITITVASAPMVVSTSPENEASAVALHSNIEIRFDQQVMGVNLSQVQILDADGNSISNIHVILNDDLLVISHDGLSNNRIYTVIIPEGVVENEDYVANKAFKFSFTSIQTAPKIIALHPVNGEKAVAVDEALTVQFDQEISEADLSRVTIFDEHNVELSALTTKISEKKLTIHHPDFKNQTLYTVTIPAGSIQNTDGVVNGEIKWSFRTVMNAPSVLSLSPEVDAEHVSVNQPILIAFDQVLLTGVWSGTTIIDGSGKPITHEVEIIEDSIISITHDGFENLATYTVTIPSGLVINEDSVGNSETKWSFTTIVNTPGKLALLSPKKDEGSVELNPELVWAPVDFAKSYTIEISSDSMFTDNILSKISEITETKVTVATDLDYYKVYYWRARAVNESGAGEWSSVSKFITKAQVPEQVFPLDGAERISTAPNVQWMSDYDQSSFDFHLSASATFETILFDTTVVGTEVMLSGLVAEETYYWRIQMQNQETNSDWSSVWSFTTRPDPEDVEDEPIVVNITFGGTSSSKGDDGGEETTKSPGSIDEKDYQLVSLPGTDQIRLDEFFEGEYLKDWRAFIETGRTTDFYNEYTPDDDQFVFRPGIGFWVLSKKIVTGAYLFTPVATNKNDAFGIALHTGWNIISNPYQSNVEWKLVQELNAISSPIYGYEQQFVEVDTMKVLKGYYYYNHPDVNMDTLFIPYTGFEQRGIEVDSTTGSSKGLPKLIVQATHGKKLQAAIEIVYSDSADKQRLALTKYHPGVERASYGVVIQKDGDEYIEHKMKRAVSTYNPEGELYHLQIKSEVGSKIKLNTTFENLPDNVRLLLMNTVTGEAQMIKSGEDHTVLTSEPVSKFEFYVGNNAALQEIEDSMLPNQVELRANYPNPFNPSTIINYGLSENSDVRIVVYDIIGRKVATLINEHQKAGWHKVRFDGSGLASGVYLYRVKVGNTIRFGKMTLVK